MVSEMVFGAISEMISALVLESVFEMVSGATLEMISALVFESVFKDESD